MSAEKLLIPKVFGDTRQKRDFGAHSIYKTPHLGNTPGVREHEYIIENVIADVQKATKDIIQNKYIQW